MSSPLTRFLNDFSFFRIKESKTLLFAYLEKNSKIYIKSKEAFIEEIYNISLQYNTENTHIISEITSMPNFTTYKREPQLILHEYLLNNNGIKLIENITFKPVSERLIEDDRGTYLNEFTPTKYLNPYFNNGCKNSDSFPHIKGLMMNLCANDEKAYEYFLKVLSHSIVNPQIKRHGFVVFQGEGASGKGTFFDLIMKPIFEDYFIADTEQVLRTNFNEYSNKCLWIFIEEKEDTRGKGSLASAIKYVSGNSKVVSEAKGKDRKITNDFRNWGITTNETNPGLELKEHDRRATIFGYSRALGGHKSKAPLVRKKLEEEIPKELDDFVSYLKNLDYDFTEIYNAFENDARKNILMLDMSNVGLFIEELKTYDGSLLNYILEDYNKSFSDLYIITRENKETKENETYIWFKDIYKLFIEFCKKNERITTKDNKFSQDFNNITGLSTKSIKDKNKISKFYRLKDILEYFNLKIENTYLESSDKTYVLDEIMEDLI